MSKERWGWVVGYEGLYMVSDEGRVMSVPRIVDKGRTGKHSIPGIATSTISKIKSGKRYREVI